MVSQQMATYVNEWNQKMHLEPDFCKMDSKRDSASGVRNLLHISLTSVVQPTAWTPLSDKTLLDKHRSAMPSMDSEDSRY